MPIFEFRCGKCGAAFEEIVMGSDRKAPPCPECGSRKTRKLVSRFSWKGASGERMASSSSCGSCGSSGTGVCSHCSSK